MRVLRRRAPGGRPGLRPARPPRLDGRAGAEGGARVRAGEARARRHARHERPAPERRAPERRHRSSRPCIYEGELLGYVANLAHHVDVGGGAPGVDRRVPRGLPGGRDHPARQARRRAAGSWTTCSGSILAQIRSTARDRRATSARRSRRTQRARAASSRSSAATGSPRCARRWTSCSSTPSGGRGRSSRRCRTASTRPRGRSTRDGFTDEPVRLPRPDRDRGPTACGSTLTGSDPQRRAPVNSTFAQTFSAVRVRPQVPDRSRPAGQRRLLPAARRARAAGHGDELHLAGAGRRRLGDADASRRRPLPRAAARLPEAAPGGDEGDDVPGRLRRARPARRATYVCFYETFAGGYGGRFGERRPGRRADARPEHGERAGRGDRAQLPGPDRAARARRGLRRAGPHARRARPAARTTASTCTTTFTILADRDRSRPVGRRTAGTTRGRAEYVHVRDGVGDAAPLEVDARPRARRRRRDPHLRRRRLRAARRARARSASCATCSRARSSAARARGGLPGRRRGRQASTTSGRRRCAHEQGGEGGDRHRRHVHGRDADRRADRRRVDREGALDAGRPVARGSCTRSGARSESRRRRGRRFVVHATTVATNAIIEGKTARGGFVTTEGFRDLLEIARQVRPTLYDTLFEKPRAARPARPRGRGARAARPGRRGARRRWTTSRCALRRRCWPTRASSRSPSACCTPTSTPSTSGGSARSWPRSCPDVPVSLSSDVAPEFREYLRASTTVINAAIRPVVGRYLERIEGRLRRGRGRRRSCS